MSEPTVDNTILDDNDDNDTNPPTGQEGHEPVDTPHDDPAAKPPTPTPTPTPIPRLGTPPDQWTPPSQDEWDRITRGLRDASGESAARKKKLRELEAALKEAQLASATAEERAAAELEKRIRKEAEDIWRPRAVAAEVRSALASAGCKDPARVSRLIDLSKIDVDDDGEISGVDEQIKQLKADLPEVFKRERPVAEPQAAHPGSTTPPSKKRTTTERQVAALLGKS